MKQRSGFISNSSSSSYIVRGYLVQGNDNLRKLLDGLGLLEEVDREWIEKEDPNISEIFGELDIGWKRGKDLPFELQNLTGEYNQDDPIVGIGDVLEFDTYDLTVLEDLEWDEFKLSKAAEKLKELDLETSLVTAFIEIGGYREDT